MNKSFYMRRHAATCVFILLFVLLCTGDSYSASKAMPKSITGVWQGTLDTGMGAKLQLFITLSKDKQYKLRGSLVSVDQSMTPIPMDAVTYNDRKLSFSCKSIGAEYSGAFDTGITSIKGVFTQNGVNFDVVFHKDAIDALEKFKSRSVVTAGDSKDIVGLWEGKLVLQAGMTLRIVVHFTVDKNNLISTIDSPDQAVNGIPAKSQYHKGVLKMVSSSVAGEYNGALSNDKTSINGTWSQMGNNYPLKLVKTRQTSTVNRPQTPKPPFPYTTRDITFANNKAHVKLAGTLSLPQGAGPFPAIVLVCGSGPHDRDETLFLHKPFLLISDYLTKNGIAVLRYDKRGIGKSKGVYNKATIEDFTQDAMAAVDYLNTCKEINHKHIGMLGHSEGGLIAPLCAVRSKDISFIIMLAGPGSSGDKVLLWQQEAIGKAMGMPAEEIKQTREITSRLIDILHQNNGEKTTDLKMRQCYDFYLKSLKLSPEKLKDYQRNENGIKALNTPWFRSFIAYQPQPILEQVKCPVLALNGSKDLQVDPKENLKDIEEALKKAGNTDFTIKEIEGVNHLFQPAKTGAPSEYNQIEITIQPQVLSIISDWVVAHTKD